ncbi:MAG: hypothetical protein FDW93_06370 [Bergeyella sp.]|nr:hypothetical protein [Bergeyella sp.]
MKTKKSTAFIFPRNSFIIGMGSVLNIFGSYFSYDRLKDDPRETDAKAIANDWYMVGQDFRNVLKNKKNNES